MFTQIRTSKANRELVTLLTRKLSLGAENVIARIAIAHSLEQGKQLDISDIKDSSGKEYAKSVLLGDKYDVYIGMICTMYGIYKTDKNLPKLLKMHLDHGLELVNEQVEDRPNVDGFEFLVELVGVV